MRVLIPALLLSACSTRSAADCDAARDAARTAWGAVAVRYGMVLSDAEKAAEERAGRLAALERQPDAPAEGKAALTAEVQRHRADADAVRPQAEMAMRVREAFTTGSPADARALAAVAAPTLQGDDVADALAKAEATAEACAE